MIHNVNTGETVYEQDGCVGTRLYESEGNEYVHLLLQPGGAIPEHSLPLAVSFCVLRGKGTCLVSGTAFEASAGDMLECPPDVQREWRNASTEPLEVLVIKRTVRRV